MVSKPVFADVLPAAGAFLVTMVRGSPIVELDPAKFDAELAHEGIALAHGRPVERVRSWCFLKLLGRSGEETETDLHHRFTGMQYRDRAAAESVHDACGR